MNAKTKNTARRRDLEGQVAAKQKSEKNSIKRIRKGSNTCLKSSDHQPMSDTSRQESSRESASVGV